MNNHNMSNIYENEMQLIDSFLDLEENVASIQKTIKETYNVDSEYDKEDNTLYIYTEATNESLSLAQAKQQVLDTMGEEMITVLYGKKS